MKRLLLLIGLGFVVLTGSTIWGVHIAEWGARERRAERFAESVLASIRNDGERHKTALGASELEAIDARAGAFSQAAQLGEKRFQEDRWELAYCLATGEGFEIWVPDPNPQRRARLRFEGDDGAPLPCPATP